MKHLFCVVVIMLSFCLPEQIIYAQDSQKQVITYDTEFVEGTSLDQSQIDEFKKDSDYNYIEEIEEETWWTRFNRKIAEIWQTFLRWLTGGDEATGFWLTMLNLLKYLLIIGLIALLVWVFLKIDNGRNIIQSNKNRVFISDDEEIIKNEDIQALIDQALQDNNYRLAVRYYYLLTLQKLSGKEVIDWQVQKTNHEYIYEIKNNDLRRQFGKLTDVYDYIWYGNFEVDESVFAKAQLAFKKINKEI